MEYIFATLVCLFALMAQDTGQGVTSWHVSKCSFLLNRWSTLFRYNTVK